MFNFNATVNIYDDNALATLIYDELYRHGPIINKNFLFLQ